MATAWALAGLALSSAAVAEGDADGDWPVPSGEALAIGAAVEAEVSYEQPKVYRVEVDGPGLLTVVAMAGNGNDLWLVVADGSGQSLADGEIDDDPVTLPGGEYASVGLPRAGTFCVVVGCWDDRAAAEVRTGFLPLEQLTLSPDPQGGPWDAAKVSVGVRQAHALSPAEGDRRDWYKLTPARSGTVRFKTDVPRDAETDLILEVFNSAEPWQAATYADEDQDGVWGRETAEVFVQEGQPMFFRVSTWDDRADVMLPYTVEARWME
jgi:hypothetical protein